MDETPLSGITVVDFSHARAGPWCTEVLGELGAEILKIEPPGGDSNRETTPKKGGMGLNFIARYRNKKSIVLNLKTERGVEIAEDLIRDADVVVENFAPGVMEEFGLGYEHLIEEVNPQIVYASIKGYGETGPYSDKKGVDLVMQAEAGIMSVTGPENGLPVKAGQAIGDIGAGLYSVIGIVTSLRRRDETGQGQKFETDLFGTIVSFMEEYLTEYSITGTNPTPNGTRHQTAVPYELFETSDGYLAVYVPGSRWKMFVSKVLDDDSLQEYDSNRARKQHYDEIMDALRPVLRKKTTEQWMKQFRELEIPCGPLNKVSDVIDHPQARERGYVVEYEDNNIGEAILHGFPMHFSRDKTVIQRGPPQLGEHTDDILSEFSSKSSKEIEKLREEGVVE